MTKKKINNLDFYFFKNLLKHKGISHFVSSKPLDLGSKDNLNTKNRQILAKALGVSFDNFIYAKQVHEANIINIRSRAEKVPDCDGFVTNIPNMFLCVVVADCAPILFFDPKAKAIGICHAGLLGTQEEIVEKTVEALIKCYKSNPRNLIVGIGPSICGKCYKKIDLWEKNKKQLLEAGVLEKNIEISNICTFENNEAFFSNSFDKGKAGRFAAVISLN